MGAHERFPALVTCVRCLKEVPMDDTDRLFWCEGCQDLARARAVRRGFMVGAALSVILFLYIWLIIQPARDLIMGGWIATEVAAFWIGSRVASEAFHGVERAQNRAALEAETPQRPSDP